jgi:hypothetical protein
MSLAVSSSFAALASKGRKRQPGKQLLAVPVDGGGCFALTMIAVIDQ